MFLYKLNRKKSHDLGAFTTSYKHIVTEKRGEKQNVGLIRLNRPKAANALCIELQVELDHAFLEMTSDDSIAAVVLTGNDKFFAAGNYCFF